jgi:dipeptidyl aminopeptidase/acylaminoacyl peptidase
VSWDSAGRQPGSTVKIYRTDSAWRRQPRFTPPSVPITEAFYKADLALIHIETGLVQTLARGYNPFAYWVSPDGKFVAFTSEHGITSGPVADGDYLDDLIVVPVDASGAGAPRLIATQAPIGPYSTGVAWSPDGRALVYATTDSDQTEHYHLVQTKDWSETDLLPSDVIRSSLTGRDGAQPLRWDPASRILFVAADSLIATVDVLSGQWHALSRPPKGVSIVALIGPASRSDLWEPNGSSLVVESRNDSTKRMGFATIGLRTGRWTQVTDKEQYLGGKAFSSSDVSTDGRTVAFVSESATEPADVWVSGTDLVSPRRITVVAPSLAGRHYGASQLIAWQTRRGDKASGALLLPAGYQPGHRYPLIVYPYPRAQRSNNVYRFGLERTGSENMQLFATRGYAVLAPDAPIQMQLADQMRALADVLLPAVDKAIALGIADSDRVGVMGHSWGGYTVLALLVQTHRFRAAVMRGGYGDLFDRYGDMDPSGSTFGQLQLESWLGATPWRDLPRYIDNSPVFFLDRVRTPLLIVEGGEDATVPPHNASQIFADLRRLGQTVEYAVYDGENHGEIAWSVPNQRDYLNRIFGWFSEYLGPSVEGGRIHRTGEEAGQ